MSGTGPLDLFSLDNDPDVIEARESVRAARLAIRRAPYGQKNRKKKDLRAAVLNSLRIENAAAKKANHVDPKPNTKTEPKAALNEVPELARDSGDDTNYRPFARKDL